jgi:hypothetical protein
MGFRLLLENHLPQGRHSFCRSPQDQFDPSRDHAPNHRALGNQVIQSLLRAGLVQPKLTIGSINDPAEREADRVAQSVMRSPSVFPGSSTCSCGKGEEVCEECKHNQSPAMIHRSAAAPSTHSVPLGSHAVAASRNHAPNIVQHVLRSPGHPLDGSTRAFFESRFGRDFSHVHIHTGPEAAASARSINANAYTAGSDIVFADGQYQPHSNPGRFLLAHELAHTLQAHDDSYAVSGNPITTVRRQTTGTPGGPDPCLDLLQAIIELLNEVAKRFNDALDDPHDLYKYHRTVPDADPDYGSWDGHRDRYNYDRDRLRQKRAEWDANDDCRGFQLKEEQAKDLEEAIEFGNKDFPEKPASSMSQSNESVWDKLRKYLPQALVGVLIAAGLYLMAAAIVGCFASGACEIAAVLAGLGFATAAAIAFILRSSGVKDQPSSGPVASSDQSPADQGQEA